MTEQSEISNQAPSQQLQISVVVPTYNRADSLSLLMSELVDQTLDTEAYEVLVIDDGSNDATQDVLKELVKQNPSFRIVLQSNAGPGAARNRGIRLAKAPLIAFTDDDCLPDSDWLEKHIAFLNAHPNLSGCGGSIRRLNESWISQYVDYCGSMRHPINADGTTVYLVTANAVYRRDVVEEVGGFREDISWPGGEDPDLSFRITDTGRRLGYCDDAVIRHQHRDTFAGLYQMFFNHGRGASMVARTANLDQHKNIRTYARRQRDVAMSYLRSKQIPIFKKPLFLTCHLLQTIAFWRGMTSQRKAVT